MDKWVIRNKKADFDAWAAKLSVSLVLTRILRNRNLENVADAARFLHTDQTQMHSPWLLPDMDKAVTTILDAITKGIKIRIIGDYDVDGVTSAAILTIGLEALGAKVDVVIPHRIDDGYGMNLQMIENAKQDDIRLIVTCDNGIAAAAPIALANEYGIRVVVTDHHEVPFTHIEGTRTELLPAAEAVVDPHRADNRYPFVTLCGGMIAYKVVEALTGRRDSALWEQLGDELMQLAALATVCDVMDLVGENRILVKEGLRSLRQTTNKGLSALMLVNGLDANALSSYHLGFVLGPCLNAAGRLDSADRALDLLLCKDPAEALRLAGELKDLNDSRKNLTTQGVKQAEQYLMDHHLDTDKVLVLYLPDVHESLAGIIAGKVREKWKRPTFVLTSAKECVKGSGRSIDAYDMFTELTKVQGCLDKYGGHKLAAGFSLKSWEEMDSSVPFSCFEETAQEKAVAAFRRLLNEACTLREEDFVSKIYIDVEMPMTYPTLALVKELELLEPFGNGNPKPLFAQRSVCFVKGTRVGVKKTAVRFLVKAGDDAFYDLMYFADPQPFLSFLDARYGVGSGELLFTQTCAFEANIAYHVGINAFRGKENLQFVMQNYC
ncbi:MAG: single-stranded-DNA-specific exonuclease RecJ [Lachnospiraceae bacterium]|jgi:single-stranded-DNA-specific exonuclease|nr:single-stranded-DNA-specific exonuclease RecJ [Lachnospiraceae bacterium]